jgi:pilus assembly protein CpaC
MGAMIYLTTHQKEPDVWHKCLPFVAQLVYALVLATLLVILMGTIRSAEAQTAATVNIDAQTKHAGEFVVPINKSQLLRLDQPVADLLVGNPEVADVLAITNRSIYVLGKQLGSTSLTIYGPRKKLIAVLDLVVAQDIESLKSRLFELMPDEDIEVRAVNGALVLSGRLSSSSAVSKAMKLATRYAGENNVINMMSVAGSQQVMLEVRFAEVSRSVTQGMRLDFNILDDDFLLLTPGAGLANTAFAALNFDFSVDGATVDVLFEALENKGLSKTLAEPTLIALSGETASFLAGGEFPIPVAQDSTGGAGGQSAITVEFKEFGVGLSFTPTVLSDGLISLAVRPEVSRLDVQNSVSLQGFEIPSLVTRRANTVVELRDGQSFAIAGLLQSNFRDSLNQLPGLGSVPILGALMRSADFEQNETELVIIVTPHLVRPAPAGSLATPGEDVQAPNLIDLFLFGDLEHTPLSEFGTDQQSGATSALGAQNAGGIVGDYGHIIQ